MLPKGPTAVAVFFPSAVCVRAGVCGRVRLCVCLYLCVWSVSVPASVSVYGEAWEYSCVRALRISVFRALESLERPCNGSHSNLFLSHICHRVPPSASIYLHTH
jgi:hypothetical protein